MKIGYLGNINGNVSTKDALKLFIKNEPTYVEDFNRLNNKMYDKLLIDGDYYFVVKNGNGFDFYKMMPAVTNDEMFKWKSITFSNGLKNLHTEVCIGKLKFNITYYHGFRDVRIGVRHLMNRYTSNEIDCFRVSNVEDNAQIKKLISQWITDFKSEIANLEFV